MKGQKGKKNGGSNFINKKKKTTEDANGPTETKSVDEKYQTLFENAQVAIFRSKIDGSAILTANRKLAELFECTKEDLMGNPAIILWADATKRDEMLAIVKNKGFITDFEIDIITTKGNRRTALTSIRIFPKDGVLEGSAVDITERKKAEDAFKRTKHEVLLRNDITHIFLTVPDERMFDQVLGLILSAFSSEFGVFGYLDEQGALVVPTMTKQVWNVCDVSQKDVVFPRDKWGESSWPTALREKRVVYSNTPSKNIPQGHVKIIRHISMPLIHFGEAIGLLQIANKKTDYTQEDLEILGALCETIAPVLAARKLKDRYEQERKTAEAALRKSEYKFKDTVKSLDEGYYSCSVAGIVLDHNIAFNRILGIDPEKDVKGAKLPDFWQDLADRTVYLEELKAKGVINNYQIKAKKSNGEHIHVIANAHFVMDENGKPIRIDGTFIDITDLKQTEEALLLKNYVFDASIAANSIADTNGIITEANDSFLSVWGYPSKAEVIGKPLLDFIKDPAEGGAIVTALNNIGRWEGDYTAKRKDGSTFMAHGFATTLRDGSGKLIGYQSAVLDVTKERQNAKELADYKESLETLVTQRTSQLTESEKKFRTLIDFAYEWEYWVDPNIHFVYVSPSCERITGYTPEEFYKDPTLMDRLLHPDSRSIFQKHIEDSHKDNKFPTIHELELKMIDKNGKEHWIVHVCRPIIDDKKRFLGRRVSNRDITERKRSDEIIRQNTALLETANKELEAFAYSVSHDLRAPLRTIDGFSQALLEDCNDKIDETGKDHIARVRAATQKMGELIDDILNLSRINRMDTKIQTVDLSGVVRAIEKELRKADPERKVEFITAPDVHITGDLNLIRIALENLIMNAWKFTSKNDRAKIEFGVQKKGETNIYFVRDDGAGFDMTFADKLFIPFQRLHSVTEFPGTGIGLALVQRIVHKHYGKIWAEGAKSRGATFYFTIFEEKRPEVLK